MKRLSKIKLLSYFVKGVTGVLGASLIMSNKFPILSVCVLSFGAGINELLNYWNGVTESRKEENRPSESESES